MIGDNVLPLGIHDVDQIRTTNSASDPRNNHWYWCRRHEKAEHVSEFAHIETDDTGRSSRVCIRIGPFMTEREADRLGGPLERFTGEDKPLGMKVET